MKLPNVFGRIERGPEGNRSLETALSMIEMAKREGKEEIRFSVVDAEGITINMGPASPDEIARDLKRTRLFSNPKLYGIVPKIK